MSLQLVASDMDGTLLRDHSQISPENVAKIKEIQQLGITFVACTGRTLEQARSVLDHYGITCPLITLNGAQIYTADNTLEFERPLSKDTAHHLYQNTDSLKVIPELLTDQGIFMRSREERFSSYVYFYRMVNHEAKDSEIVATLRDLESKWHIKYAKGLKHLIDTHNVLKMTFFTDHDIALLKALQYDLTQRYPDISVTSSGLGNIEISSKEAQKGLAIARFAKDNGISLDRTMTIGDNLNDISMLKVAKYSFAVGNAQLEVRQAAKHLTKTNVENGVSLAIDKAITMSTQTTH